MDRLKRRISRVKGQSSSPETLMLQQQKNTLVDQLEDARLRHKSLAKQAIKVQVSLTSRDPQMVGSSLGVL